MASNTSPPRGIRRFAAGLVATAVLASGLAACGKSGSSAGGGTIVLGAEASRSGSGAAVGVPQLNGIRMAVDEINDAGGVKTGSASSKLDLKVLDDESKPTLAVQNVQKLLQEGSHYLVGTLSSGAIGAYLPIIKNRDDVISMVSGAVLPGITSAKPVYRFQTETVQLDEGMGNVLVADGAKKIAMLTDKSHAGYVANTDSYVRKLTGAGIEVTTRQQYQFGDTQYGPQIGAMLRTKPDALVFRGYATDLLRAISTARQLGYQGPIVSSAGYTDKEVADVHALAVMRGVTDVASPPVGYIATAGKDIPAALVAQAKKFSAAYQARFGQAPGLLSANGYESVYILAAAMSKAGTASDVPKVRGALDAMTPGAVPNAVLPVAGATLFDKHQTRFQLVKIIEKAGTLTPVGEVASTLGAS